MAISGQSSILWQSQREDVTLIDIPRSISSAQGSHDHPCHDILLSTVPLDKTYQTNEPKTAAAREKLINNTVDSGLHAEYAELLADALAKVKTSYDQPWCLPRPFVEQASGENKKRKRTSESVQETTATDGEHSAVSEQQMQAGLPDDLLSSLSTSAIARVYGIDGDDASHETRDIKLDPHDADESSQKKISLAHPRDPTTAFDFLLPPESSFILGPCSDSSTLRTSTRAQAQALDVSKAFDFILLDPPWPNRSVKRTHKTANSTYATAATLDDIHQLLIGMDLDVLMSDSCLVAVWITNKPAIRDLVLGEGGLFGCWGVEFAEEWLWLKTTQDGEPVTPIDSVWRKPYEVLLLGRKRRNYSGATQGVGEIKRRILMSVPDLHSRKPCLKELIEPMMFDSNAYRGLEVFARHLVAGWWSWGDECIKFNWEGYWRQESEASGVQSIN